MIYLDHNATTPVRPEALKELLPFLESGFGNPSSAYRLGQEARKGLEKARARVAALLGASPQEIVFTSGGSEADALAIQGGAEAARAASGGRRRRVLASAVEHEAVLESLKVLEARGFDVELLSVDASGRLAPQTLAAKLSPDVALASVMFANNEVGTLQPVAELAKLCRDKGVLFHTDAVQGAGKAPLDVRALGVDLLSLSGHKLGAPKGIGALLIRPGVELVQLVTGKQEKKRRGGTENVAGAAAFGRACELAAAELPAHAKKLAALRDRLEAGVLAKTSDARVNGPKDGRICNTSHLSFRELDGHALMVALDLEGVCVSTGSACSTGQTEVSHVLKAMGVEPDWGAGSIRVSLGYGSSEADVDRFLELLPPAVEKLRKAHRALSL